MSVNWFSQSGAEAVQKLAVLGHGLGQILRKIVLHKKFPPKLSLLFYFYIMGLLKAIVGLDQKRSERIRDLPCSSIALTRSCFMEIFFIAIPPKKS